MVAMVNVNKIFSFFEGFAFSPKWLHVDDYNALPSFEIA